MKNEERLLEFLHKRWRDLGQPEALSLSASEISKEWTIIKNEVTRVSVPYELHTSRGHVSKMLKKLEARKLLEYDTSNKTNPIIKLKV